MQQTLVDVEQAGSTTRAVLMTQVQEEDRDERRNQGGLGGRKRRDRGCARGRVGRGRGDSEADQGQGQDSLVQGEDAELELVALPGPEDEEDKIEAAGG